MEFLFASRLKTRKWSSWSARNRLMRGVWFFVQEQCHEKSFAEPWCFGLLKIWGTVNLVYPFEMGGGLSSYHQVCDHILGLICTLVCSIVLWLKGVADRQRSSLCHPLPTNLPYAGYWNSYRIDDSHLPNQQLADHPLCFDHQTKALTALFRGLHMW